MLSAIEIRPPEPLRAAPGGWVLCPRCGRGKVLRLRPGTRATELEVYCKRCRQPSVLDIDAAGLRVRPETSTYGM